MTGTGTTRLGLLQLSLAAVLWGSIGIAVHLLQDAHLPTLAIAFWRFVCACLVLLPFVGGSGLRRLAHHLERPGHLLAVSLGSLAFQLFYFFAVADLGASASTLITLGVAPVALTAARAATTRTFPSTRTLLVMAVALAGLVMVTTAGADTRVGDAPVRGTWEAVASGLSFAASTASSAKLSTRLPPAVLTFAVSLFGVVALAPVLAVDGWHVPTTATQLTGTVWLGVIATVLAYGLFYAGLRTVPSHTAMILTLLEPATTVVLAAVVLGEPLTLVTTLGAVLLLTSVALLFLAAEGRGDPRGPGDGTDDGPGQPPVLVLPAEPRR